MHEQSTADAYVALRSKDGEIVGRTVIDAADEALVTQWRWNLNAGGYAARSAYLGGGRGNQNVVRILLHRVLLGLAPGDPRQGDHRDLDPSNNRRANLRIVTGPQNAQNLSARRGGTSKHRGVSWDAQAQMWRAQCQIAGRNHNIGRFADEDEAGRRVAAFRREHMPFSEADHER